MVVLNFDCMHITLECITVNKYKSYQQQQSIKIEPNVTVFVGMNESGKSVLLEAMAKLNYFDSKDLKFKFDTTQDYPRKELVKFQRANATEEIIRAKFRISESLIEEINNKFGKGVLTSNTYEYSQNYNSDTNTVHNFSTNTKAYIDNLPTRFKSHITAASIALIGKATNISELKEIEFAENEAIELVEELNAISESQWTNPLEGYLWKSWIKPHQPKFWYFDDYYQLEGRINLDDYNAGKYGNEKSKMVEALLDIAGIKVNDLLAATNFENFTAQLEAASNEISEQLFTYWSGNKNLEIEFKIDKVTREVTRQVQVFHPSYPNQVQYAQNENVTDTISETIIDIRVKNTTHKITLPLDRRSKGFNWFFSFIVWFNKVKNDSSSNYILLFDEPGLNLHALAQADLLKFLEDLGTEYQVIFSTHSPFMIDSDNLYRIRTILETENGSVASDSIQEKDSNTLFPLQAALGYDIAQNLFISKNNLLVEGPADLLYLTVLSNILEADKRTGLKESITIIPIGGLDKVSTFISLLRGSKLNVACLLDTFTDPSGKQRVDDLIKHKIIKEKNIRFFNEFLPTPGTAADIEDMFKKEDYLNLFNATFLNEYPQIKLADLDPKILTTVKQINKIINKDRYNHYKPAYKLNQLGADKTYFSNETLNNFEKIFIELNKLFS